MEYKICLEEDCKAQFYINDRDLAFFESKGLDSPKRCWVCRRKRKAVREAALGIVNENADKDKK